VTSKWIFIDESGTEPRRASSAGGYFALCAVAVDDAEAARSVLTKLLLELEPQGREHGVSRVLRRGCFHASQDTSPVRRYFLRGVSALQFHCRVARVPWIPRPALTPYDALIVELFETMGAPGRWTDVMHVVIAAHGAQRRGTGKGQEYQRLFVAIRRYLESRFPGLAREMPDTHPVAHVPFAEEPCLQLPDYCGWAVQRWLRDGDEEWLRALSPKGPGWNYDRKGLILPPDTAGLYVAAGEITGVDFFCG
jgi:hypothetical protein